MGAGTISTWMREMPKYLSWVLTEMIFC
jgi:hypothetical protein